MSYRDNVVWDKEQEDAAKRQVEENSKVTASEQDIEKYEADADKFWDKFYGIHQNRFVKNSFTFG